MGIGSVLKSHIEEAGRNKHEVANAAGIPPSTLQSMIDRDGGKNTLNLVRVARVLGITVEQLYEEAGMLEPAVRPISLALAQQIDRLDDAGRAAIEQALMEQDARMSTQRFPAPGEEQNANNRRNVPALPTLGFREAGRDVTDTMRSGVFYLEALVPGLTDEAAPGDILVVLPGAAAAVGDTGVYQWDGRYFVCLRRQNTLLVRGPQTWSRSLVRPHEHLGKVVGTLHL